MNPSRTCDLSTPAGPSHGQLLPGAARRDHGGHDGPGGPGGPGARIVAWSWPDLVLWWPFSVRGAPPRTALA